MDNRIQASYELKKAWIEKVKANPDLEKNLLE